MENKEIMYVGETTLSHFHEKNKETYSPIEHTHSWDDLDGKPFTVIKGNPTVLIDNETKSFIDASAFREGFVCFNIEEFIFKEKHYYDVIINGASYSCISSSSNENGVITLGNHSIIEENAVDTEEPFFAISSESTLGICAFFYEGEQGDYTISIIEYPSIERFDGVMEYEKLLNTPELVQADLSENDITKQSYVLNRTHWTENVENVLLPETTVQKMGEGNYYFIIEGVIVDIQIGEEYVVVWNGIDYVCTAKGYLEKGGSTTPYIGDMSKLDEECESTGEPFVALFYSEGTMGNLNDNSIEATFEIKQIINVTHQLDERYLPETTKYQSDWNENDETSPAYVKNRPFYTTDIKPIELCNGVYGFENMVEVQESLDGYYSSTENLFSSTELVVGEPIIIVYDGVEYNLIVSADEDQSLLYAGNGSILTQIISLLSGMTIELEDTGEPFVLFSSVIFTLETDSEHNISISRYENEDIILPHKYLGLNIWAGEGEYSTIIGSENNIASGKYSFSCGINCKATGHSSCALGGGVRATGDYSYAEGYAAEATGSRSHAEGSQTIASGNFGAHSEGRATIAYGEAAHAEGNGTYAIGEYSHASGSNTMAVGKYSYTEGIGYDNKTYFITLTGDANATTFSVESDYDAFYKDLFIYSKISPGVYPGNYITDCTVVDNKITEITVSGPLSKSALSSASYSITIQNIAAGIASHVEGLRTLALSNYQHVQGKYNSIDKDNKYVHIVGNGTSDTSRSNAHTLDWEGNAEYQSDVKANACGGENPISLIALHEKVNDCEPFIITVTVSADPSITECTMDKTFAEIEAAYKNGKKLYVVDTSMYRYHNLCDYSEGNSISFYSCNFSGGLYWIQSFRIDSDNTITRNYDTISLGTDKLETSAFTVTGAINEMNTNIRALQKIVTPTAIILSSPNGTRFNITIGDDGILTATEIETTT